MDVSCRISEEERRKRLERLRGLMNKGGGNSPFPKPVKKEIKRL